MERRLDPERLRAVLARYFDRMKAIVERHGGSVEKFIGDAVMAVFGVPALHEDDALRAVRAAAEMRDALPRARARGTDRRHDRGGGDGDGGAARDRGCRQRRRSAGAGGPTRRRADRPIDARARSQRSRRRADRASRAEGQVEAGSRLPAAARARRAGAPARGNVSWAANASSRSLQQAWERVRAEGTLRADHGRGGCGRRQVSARRGGCLRRSRRRS